MLSHLLSKDRVFRSWSSCNWLYSFVVACYCSAMRNYANKHGIFLFLCLSVFRYVNILEFGTSCGSITICQRENLSKKNVEGLHQKVFIATLIIMTQYHHMKGIMNQAKKCFLVLFSFI